MNEKPNNEILVNLAVLFGEKYRQDMQEKYEGFGDLETDLK
jgi:hypothetical protein